MTKRNRANGEGSIFPYRSFKVPTRAVMGVMGWSQASMVSRYQHIPDEVREEIARQRGGLFWGSVR